LPSFAGSMQGDSRGIGPRSEAGRPQLASENDNFVG
jgi:hypothetical protein